jgi:hypothetical protein
MNTEELDDKTIENLTKDYIVEQGRTTDGLFYELWNSGKAELWGYIMIKQISSQLMCFDTNLPWKQTNGIELVGSVTPCNLESSYTLRGSSLHYFTWYNHTGNNLRVGVIRDSESWDPGATAHVSLMIKGRWEQEV